MPAIGCHAAQNRPAWTSKLDAGLARGTIYGTDAPAVVAKKLQHGLDSWYKAGAMQGPNTLGISSGAIK
jgi:hypothetical protein